MHDKVIGWTQTGFTGVYAQSLSADCDLDLSPSNMILVLYTLSCHDDNLCQTVFKSHLAGRTYGPDTILEHTNENTHIHTYGYGKLYMPFCHFMAGHKKGNSTLEKVLITQS